MWIKDSKSALDSTILVSGTMIPDCRFLELNSGFQSLGLRISQAKISHIRESGCMGRLTIRKDAKGKAVRSLPIFYREVFRLLIVLDTLILYSR